MFPLMGQARRPERKKRQNPAPYFLLVMWFVVMSFLVLDFLGLLCTITPCR